MIILCDMIDSEEERLKFECIYEMYKVTMYSVAYDIVKNLHDAEDIVEESMIKVIDILDNIEERQIGTSKCKNLMITIAKNRAVDYWRKSKRMPILLNDIDVQKTYDNVEELYINLENYRELIQCLNTLEDKYLDVLNLKVLHHLSSKQVAGIIGISEANVNMRFMRAKKMLAKKLKERCANE